MFVFNYLTFNITLTLQVKGETKQKQTPGSRNSLRLKSKRQLPIKSKVYIIICSNLIRLNIFTISQPT